MTETRRADRLRAILRKRSNRRRWEALIALGVALVSVIIPLVVVPRGVQWWQSRRDAALAALRETPPEPAIRFPDEPGQPLTISRLRWTEIGMRLASVAPAPPPPPLKMDGVLCLDPDDLSLVRSRFEGEVVEMSTFADSTSSSTATHAAVEPVEQMLRFGDEVRKGQLLAVIWSRELGEKKSELSHVLSQLAFDRETLSKLREGAAAIAMNTIREAERRVRSGEIEAANIEKTLRAWQLTPTEIDDIRREIESENSGALSPTLTQGRALDRAKVDRWARVEIRSPINGTIVEKNINVGMLVDTSGLLFKIANLDHLDVRAFAYEEDLAVLQRLSKDQRRWTIQLKGDPETTPIQGSIDRIGSLIDPLQHTGLVMGWVSNENRQLRAGQFVTAKVMVPDKSPYLSVPAESIVDVDGKTLVLAQGSAPETFTVVEVRVVRFQDKIACVNPCSREGFPDCLYSGQQVVSSGAVEILTEYQRHLRAHLPDETQLAPHDSGSVVGSVPESVLSGVKS